MTENSSPDPPYDMEHSTVWLTWGRLCFGRVCSFVDGLDLAHAVHMASSSIRDFGSACFTLAGECHPPDAESKKLPPT